MVIQPFRLRPDDIVGSISLFASKLHTGGAVIACCLSVKLNNHMPV